jgi:hypothetical protein
MAAERRRDRITTTTNAGSIRPGDVIVDRTGWPAQVLAATSDGGAGPMTRDRKLSVRRAREHAHILEAAHRPEVPAKPAGTPKVPALILRTAPAGKYHVATGAPDYTDPANNREPVGDAGLCGRLDAGARFPAALEWDPVSMDVPGWLPEVLCGDCRRIWAREAIVTQRVLGEVV